MSSLCCFVSLVLFRLWQRRRFFFFFNDTATTEIYTLSLHDALPILTSSVNSRERSGINTILHELNPLFTINVNSGLSSDRKSGSAGMPRPISYAVFCLKKKNKTPIHRHERLSCTAGIARVQTLPALE